MPAFACGLVRWAEKRNSRFFLYLEHNWSVIIWARWVSCAMSMAIFSNWIVLLIMLHLDRKVIFSDGALAPFFFFFELGFIVHS